jgi:uncharacterized membrane protein (DUF485 family)
MEVLSMSDVISPGSGGEAIRKSAAAGQQTLAHDDWESIERDGEFRELVHRKRNFIIPATIFFIVYYFGFLILVGYFPSVVDVNVIGNINIAYLFALSEFIMAWIITALYVWRAGLFDSIAQRILERVKR